MKRLFIIPLLLMVAAYSSAQQFRGHYTNQELKISLEINLEADSIAVPGIPDEWCYGYLQGNLNGTWIILKVVSIKEKKATVRAACDNGSDSQTIELVQTDERTITMRQVGGANIKTIQGRKYVKLPKTVEFKK